MDRLNLALREVEGALLSAEDAAEKKRLQARYLRIFAAIEARRNNDELTTEELEDWTNQEYERNGINPFSRHPDTLSSACVWLPEGQNTRGTP